MKAAIAHHMRPSVLVLGKDSNDGWGEWDTLLAKAYQRFLEELCQQCGNPKYLCHTDDNRVEFVLRTDDCAATAVAEKEQANRAEKQRKNPNSVTYGEKVFAEPKLTLDAIEEGMEFSDFRRPYYFDQAKRRGLIPEEATL